MSETQSRFQLNFGYNRFADLFYYLLAHMPLDCAADVYDPEFTAQMARDLGIHPLIPQRLTEYYQEHFDRVGIVSFLPLITDNTKHCREAMAACGQLTKKDMTYFAEPMMEICDRVCEPFYGWWEETHRAAAERKQKVYDRFNALAEKFRPFLDSAGVEQKLLFSYTIRKNGRAFQQPDRVTVYVKFPEKDEEITGCFLQFLHECTHRVTDPLMNRQILMADGSHDLSEYQVLVYDEYLIRTLCPELEDAYREWIGEELLEAAHEGLGEDGCANLEKLIEPLTIQNS